MPGGRPPADAVPAAVVTGAARGLGRAIATRLASRGRLVVGVDMDGDELAASIASLPGEGHRSVAGNAGSRDTLSEAFAAIPASATLQTFVANAGIARPGASIDFPMQTWDELHDVLLRAVFLGAREAARRMAAGSSVVMISSINGTLGFGGRAAYAAAKAGVQGLVRSLAVEWAERGIRVNAVAPGTVSTEMQQAFMQTGYASPERFLRHVPMNRFGRPEEVADAVEFLASEAASYVTGVVLPVDGGWAAFGMAADD